VVLITLKISSTLQVIDKSILKEDDILAYYTSDKTMETTTNKCTNRTLYWSIMEGGGGFIVRIMVSMWKRSTK